MPSLAIIVTGTYVDILFRHLCYARSCLHRVLDFWDRKIYYPHSQCIVHHQARSCRFLAQNRHLEIEWHLIKHKIKENKLLRTLHISQSADHSLASCIYTEYSALTIRRVSNMSASHSCINIPEVVTTDSTPFVTVTHF